MHAQPRIPTVTIAVRIRLADGKRRYTKPVFVGNGRLKAGFALVDGKATHHPEAIYTLRYRTADGQAIWETVGADPQSAVTAKLRREISLQAELLGMLIPLHATPPRKPKPQVVAKGEPGSGTLTEAVRDYLIDTQLRNRARTLASYTSAMTLFLQSCNKRTVADIGRGDVMEYQALLRSKGNGDRTTANRV